MSCGGAVLGEPLCVGPSAPSLVTAATVSSSVSCAFGLPLTIGISPSSMSLRPVRNQKLALSLCYSLFLSCPLDNSYENAAPQRMKHPDSPSQPAIRDVLRGRTVANSVLISALFLALAFPLDSRAQTLPATPQAVVTAAVVPPSGGIPDRLQDGRATPAQVRAGAQPDSPLAMPTARPLPTPDIDLPIDGVSRPRTSPQTLAILGGLVVASLTLLTWGRLQRWRSKRAIEE